MELHNIDTKKKNETINVGFGTFGVSETLVLLIEPSVLDV